MLKLLYVDPWGSNGLDEYSNNLVSSLKHRDINIIYVSNYYVKNMDSIAQKHYFKYTERIKNKIFRKPLRLLEYFFNQLHLIIKIFQLKPNIVHLQWGLFFLIDIPIYKLLKLLFPKITFFYTSHNLVNHNYNDFYFRKIFINLFHVIITHGDKHTAYLKTKINSNNIYTIPHGSKNNLEPLNLVIPPELQDLQFSFSNKVYFFFGHLKNNKGIINLIDIFNDTRFNNSTLIIAGKPDNFKIITEIKKRIKPNIILIPRFINNFEKNYIFSISNIILLPYKNGSLSGVLFTAASYKKACLSLNFGIMSDYIINNKTSFLVNNLLDFKNRMIQFEHMNHSILESVGLSNYEHINNNFNWEEISFKYDIIYKKYFNAR